MKKSRLTAAICVIMAMLIALAACSGNSPSGGTTAGTSAGTTTTSAAKTSAKTSEATTTTAPPANEELRFSVLTWEYTDPTVKTEDLMVHKALEEGAGVIIDYETVPNSDYTNVVSTRFAAGIDLPDVITMVVGGDNTMYFNLAKQGVILEMTDVIPQWPNLYQALYVDYPDMARQITSPDDGKIYWLPWAVYNCDMQDSMVLYRTDWLEALNMEVPNTVDGFYDFLKLCQENDLNGNGKKDEYTDINWFGNVFIPAFGAHMTFFPDADGNLQHNQIQPEYREYMQFFNKLYTEGLMDPDSFSYNNEIFNNRLTNNQISATCAEGYRAAAYTEVMWEQANMPETCRFVASYDFMYGRDGQHGVYRPRDQALFKLFLTSDENLKAAMTYIDFCASKQGQNINKYGVEGVHWQYAADGSVDTSLKQNTLATEGFAGTLQVGIGSSWIFKVEVWDPDAYFTLREGLIKYGYDHETLKKAWDRMGADQSVIEYDFTYGMTTPAEADEVASYSELRTYMGETNQKFQAGVLDFDQWDAYVAQCKKMGLDDYMALLTKLYNRYMGN